MREDTLDSVNCAKAGLESADHGLRAPGTVGVFSKLLHSYRWPVVVLIGFLSVGHFAGAVQREPDVLKTGTVVAEKFEVPGPNGKPVAMLYRSDEGQPLLVFLNEKQELRLAVGINPNGKPGITLFDENNKLRLSISILPPHNLPQLQLSDDQGNATVALAMTKEFGPAMSIGSAEKGRVTIGLSKGGEPTVFLWAKNDQPRIALELVDGDPVIKLMDGNKVVRSRWNVLPDGSPKFSILDDRSRERLSMGTDNNGLPFIRFIDPSNNTSKDIR